MTRHFGLTARPVVGGIDQPGGPHGSGYALPNSTSAFVEAVRRLLEYDPATGKFEWKVIQRGQRKKMAGCINSKGYRKLRVLGRTFLEHRLAWLYFHGVSPNGIIDHIDGNPLNNAISNLREATFTQSSRNRKAKGCYFDKRRNVFTAQIKVNKRVVFLGSFPTEDLAVAAYLSATAKYFAEFSVVNSRPEFRHA